MPYRPGRVCTGIWIDAVRHTHEPLRSTHVPCSACRQLRLVTLEEKYPATSGRRGYDAAWRKLATAAVAHHVRDHGWICPGWRRPPHHVHPGELECDHLDPDKRDGLTADDVQVLCHSCNSRKGGRRPVDG